MMQSEDKVGSDRPRVYLGMPTHSGGTAGAYKGLMAYPAQRCAVTAQHVTASLLAFAFNLILADGLNAYHDGEADYLAMLHSDIEPEPYWLDKLMAEMERTGALVLSSVVPIKGPEGTTSTALGEAADEWAQPRRLTMREACSLPLTFTAADVPGTDSGSVLLINTGCWLARMGPWMEGMYFTVRDRIVRGKDGRLRPEVIPEDWGWSRWMAAKGIDYRATRVVSLEHQGPWGWSNQEAYGTWETDEAWQEAQRERAA